MPDPPPPTPIVQLILPQQAKREVVPSPVHRCMHVGNDTVTMTPCLPLSTFSTLPPLYLLSLSPSTLFISPNYLYLSLLSILYLPLSTLLSLSLLSHYILSLSTYSLSLYSLSLLSFSIHSLLPLSTYSLSHSILSLLSLLSFFTFSLYTLSLSTHSLLSLYLTLLHLVFNLNNYEKYENIMK